MVGARPRAKQMFVWAGHTALIAKVHCLVSSAPAPLQVDRDQVVLHSNLIESLYTLTGGASITKSIMSAAVKLLAESQEDSWHLSSRGSLEDFVETMSRRLRNLLHDVGDARGNKAKWLTPGCGKCCVRGDLECECGMWVHAKLIAASHAADMLPPHCRSHFHTFPEQVLIAGWRKKCRGLRSTSLAVRSPRRSARRKRQTMKSKLVQRRPMCTMHGTQKPIWHIGRAFSAARPRSSACDRCLRMISATTTRSLQSGQTERLGRFL